MCARELKPPAVAKSGTLSHAAEAGKRLVDLGLSLAEGKTGGEDDSTLYGGAKNHSRVERFELGVGSQKLLLQLGASALKQKGSGIPWGRRGTSRTTRKSIETAAAISPGRGSRIRLGEALEQASCSGKFRTHAHRKDGRLTRGGLGGEAAAIFFDELEGRKAGSVRCEGARGKSEKKRRRKRQNRNVGTSVPLKAGR